MDSELKIVGMALLGRLGLLPLGEWIWQSFSPSRRRMRRKVLARRDLIGTLWRHVVRPNDLAFDIGANVGDRSAALLHIGARVVAVEPNPELATYLRAKYSYHPRIQIVEAGVGALEEQRTLYVSSNSAISTLNADWVEAMNQRSGWEDGRPQWNRPQQIRMTTLDALIREHGLPAFVKIDVEGFELQVLSGLTQPIPALAFEITPEFADPLVACINLLEALDHYEYNFSEGEGFRFDLPTWVEAATAKSMLRERCAALYWGDCYARLKRVQPQPTKPELTTPA